MLILIEDNGEEEGTNGTEQNSLWKVLAKRTSVRNVASVIKICLTPHVRWRVS